MSLITCTSGCIYQTDGICTLDTVSNIGTPSNSGCIHYIPKNKYEYDKGAVKIKNKPL